MSKKQVIVFVVVMLIVTAFAFWKADFIKRYGSVAQVWVMVMLVLLTAAYVLSTRKMAQEMKEQRYAALKPIIDIQRQEGSGLDFAREEIAAIKGELPQALPCKLRNIGPGPAIGVHSFIEHPLNKRSPWDFGTIATGGEMVPPALLVVEPNDDRGFLVAYYKDVYDRSFKSSRELILDTEKGQSRIGPLKIVPLPEEEFLK